MVAATLTTWEALAAVGTFFVAAVTAWLAGSTRSLAKAASDDLQAQWRPVLAVGTQAPVSYDDRSGALSVQMRNVGRGPAFGVNAQIRSGKQALGASIPGTDAVVVAPGETFRLSGQITDPSINIRGLALRIDVSYYDLAERWHISHLTMTGRKPVSQLMDPSVVPELEIASVFTYDTGRKLLPVLGSPRAVEEQARHELRWSNRLRRRWTGKP